MDDPQVTTLIEKTLGTLGVPVNNLVYDGTEQEYINYALLHQEDVEPADDEPTATECIYAASIFSPTRHKPLRLRARRALRQAGFYGIRTTGEGYGSTMGRSYSTIQFKFLEEE